MFLPSLLNVSPRSRLQGSSPWRGFCTKRLCSIQDHQSRLSLFFIFLFGPLLTPASESNVVAQQILTEGYTYHRTDGNRLISGNGDSSTLEPLDIPLSGAPLWLVGATFENGAIWVAVQANGTVESIKTVDSTWTQTQILPGNLPAGMPPLLQIREGHPSLIIPKGEFSPFSHAIPLPDSDSIAYLTIDGDIVVQSSNSTASLPISALPDARLITDGGTRIAVLTAPTNRYRHGVLGDQIEASAITIVSTKPSPQIIRTIEIDFPWVVEGIAPIWADLNGDSVRELIVTLSSPSDGGKIVVYNEDGSIAAEGPGIGRGFRWRNQMAVAPYGPKGELELSAVKTPHIGGTVEFFRWREDRLEIVASIPGFTSHVIRSRNLDLNVSGNFLGTNKPIVLLPNNRRTVLNGIQHTEQGARVALTLPIGAPLSSNPASVPLADGRIAVAIGRSDGILRVWSPGEEFIRLTIQASPQSQSEPNLIVFGQAGSTYWIEESDDLKVWKKTIEVTIPREANHLSFPHHSETRNSQRFFRATRSSSETSLEN